MNPALTRHQILEHLEWAQAYAKTCASRFSGDFDQDDLQSAGIVAFLHAVERFDHDKGVPLRGFCAIRIRGAIIDEARRWGWAPRSFYRRHRLLETATLTLISELNREPTSHEVAVHLGIDESSVLEIHKFDKRRLVAWDEPSDWTGEEEGGSLFELVADEKGLRPDANILSSEKRKELLVCISRLPRMQAMIVVLHYLKDTPFREVAKLTGLTASRISQLHHQALNRLKLVWNPRLCGL